MKPSTRRPTPSKAFSDLRDAFRKQFGIGIKSADDLLQHAHIYDKAYELCCLIRTMRGVSYTCRGCSFTLVNGSAVSFSASGGAITRGARPHVRISRGSSVEAEIWVDIEVLALSAWRQGKSPVDAPYGMAHELDIVVVKPGTSGRLVPARLFIGVEAKHRPFTKALLKELLGVRRETAFKSKPKANRFARWKPNRKIPANPPVGLVLLCSHPSVHNYNDPAEFWGIEMAEYYF